MAAQSTHPLTPIISYMTPTAPQPDVRPVVKTRPAQKHAALRSLSALFTNTLRLNQPDEGVHHFRVYDQQDELNRRVELGPKLLHNPSGKPVFTAFERAGADETSALRIDLRSNHGVTRHYYRFLLERYMRSKGHITCRSDFGELTVLVEELPGKASAAETVRLFAFSLRILSPAMGHGWMLRISYKGQRFMLRAPLSSIGKHNRHVRLVSFRQQLMRLDTAEEQFNAPADEIYPMLNPGLNSALRLPQGTTKGESLATDRQVNYVKGFLKRFMHHPDFKRAFPFADLRNQMAFARVPSANLHKVDSVHQQLQLGGGNIIQHGVLPQSIRKYGPYQRAGKTVVSCLIVFAENDTQPYKWLRQFLEGQLCDFMKIVFRTEGVAKFRDGADLIPQTEAALHTLSQRGIKPDLVWYISPWGPHDPDQENQLHYFRFKEMMTGKGLASQVIRTVSVKQAMPYYTCNLAIKLWFKLHGIPWLMAQRAAGALVMGLNIYRIPGGGAAWTAGILCMSEAEQLMQMGTEKEDSIENLLEAVQLSLDRMLRAVNREHISEIVVHYHKPLNRGEARQIRDLLQRFSGQTGKDVSVYVMAISSGNDGEHQLWRERQQAGKRVNDPLQPLEAVRLPGDEWLLCTHNRKNPRTKSVSPNLLRVGIEKVSGTDGEPLPLSESKQHELIAQLVRFCMMNWKSVLPGMKPLSLEIPGYMAKLAAKLPAKNMRDRYLGRGVVNL